jgi:hypothetical protein
MRWGSQPTLRGRERENRRRGWTSTVCASLLVATREAPAERGRASESAAEKWTIGEDGLIAASLGHFDQDEYDWQLAG